MFSSPVGAAPWSSVLLRRLRNEGTPARAPVCGERLPRRTGRVSQGRYPILGRVREYSRNCNMSANPSGSLRNRQAVETPNSCKVRRCKLNTEMSCPIWNISPHRRVYTVATGLSRAARGEHVMRDLFTTMGTCSDLGFDAELRITLTQPSFRIRAASSNAIAPCGSQCIG